MKTTTEEVQDLLKELNAEFGRYKKRSEDELDTVRDAIRTLETQGARIPAGGGSESIARPGVSAALNAYFRRNDTEALSKFAPQDAMSIGSGPDGGFTVLPSEFVGSVTRLARQYSPLRSLAKVVTVGQDRNDFLFNIGGIGSGRVGEQSSRPVTANDKFDIVTPPMGEYYSNVPVFQRLLDDSYFNVEAHLTESQAIDFGVMEGADFTNGLGVLGPKGYLTNPISLLADAARPFGTLQYLPTGAAGAFIAGAGTADVLISLVHSLRAPYRAGPGVAWLMNSKTFAVVRQLKDLQGNYLVRTAPGNIAGAPDMMLGFPVYEDENLPDIAANSLSIAFGNWQMGFGILDHRIGIRMLRDPLTVKGSVNFYTTRRVGGSVLNSQTIKLLRFSVA